MLVKVYKLGEDQLVNTFPSGTHVLGRGPILQCNDKRVSRNHATIEITQDNAKLTSTHVNPCFLRAANSKTITILSNNSSTELNDGDSFALLPEDFWFTVKLEENGEETEFKIEGASKRLSQSYDEEVPPDKKMKIEDDSVNNTLDDSNIPKEDADDGVEGSSANGQNLDVSTDAVVKEESDLGEDAEKSTDNVDQNEEIKEERSIDNDENETVTSDANAGTADQDENQQNSTDQDPQQADPDQPSGSLPKPRRERCFYGAQCYRKNPIHRQDFTHPGDSDYDSDPDDKRPICPYGANCYRKNQDHRRNYKHPSKQPPGKQTRNRKKVQRLNVADSEEMRGLSDEDSEEDPFIVDDDSDEYVGDSDEEDSDWEESQDVDEDSQNIKRLVKEAKRFTKN